MHTQLRYERIRCARVKQNNNRSIEDFAYTCQTSTLVISLLNPGLLLTHGVHSSLGRRPWTKRLLLPLRLIQVRSRSRWWRSRRLSKSLMVWPSPVSRIPTRTLPRHVTVPSTVETPSRVWSPTFPKMVLGANVTLGWPSPGVAPWVERSLPSSVRRSVLGGAVSLAIVVGPTLVPSPLIMVRAWRG